MIDFHPSHSAKVLAKMVLQDPRLRTYADIGQAAFGPKANGITSFLFCLELFAVRFADSSYVDDM